MNKSLLTKKVKNNNVVDSWQHKTTKRSTNKMVSSFYLPNRKVRYKTLHNSDYSFYCGFSAAGNAMCKINGQWLCENSTKK